MSGIKLLYNRRGFALEATLFVLLLLAVLCVFAVSGVTTTTRTANYDYRNTRASYAAEAASDDIMQQLSGMVDDGFISQVELDSLARPTVPGFSIPTMTVLPNGGATQETINEPPFAGLYALVRNYDITTRAADSSGNASRAVVTVKAAAIPIFQFGVFYEKDLEITNGPRLDMQGWVHTNGSIYARSSGGLYLHNSVTTPNKFYFRRKDGSVTGATQVYIDDAGGTARQVDNDSDGLPSFPAFRTWSETRFSGRLKTNAYGVDSLRLPLPTSVPPEELIADRNNGGTDSPEEVDSKFAWKADFYINLDYSRLNNTLCDAAGATDIQYIRTAGRTTPTAAECALIFQADSNKWWESREQTFVDEITIDYAQLFTWMAATTSNQSSILYITVRNIPGVDETYPAGARCPTTACAFRPFPVLKIVNASVLGRPFTIATNLPVYVQGNYNSTANWQPSAIIGDAFTWLSPSFTTTNYTNRATASATVGGVTRYTHPKIAASSATIYAAILAGHGATPFDWVNPGVAPPGCNYTGTGSQSFYYGGGLENFPRFLENWGGGVTAFYRGSLVSIAYAQRATNFCGWALTYYTPPTRDWAFDTRFQDPANLPPGTPVVGSVVQTAYRPVYE